MLEKDIERKVCKYAEKLGWLQFKFNSDNTRGVPDRIFFRNGVTVLIEFKRKGGRLSPNQTRRIKELQNQNIPVYVVWDVDEGFNLFDSFEK